MISEIQRKKQTNMGKQKPLIKWPGGKSGEIAQIRRFVPAFDRYVEPFVGGGALLFYLEPEKAIINDNSEYLMEFYTLTKQQDPAFRAALEWYCSAFQGLIDVCDSSYARIYAMYRLYQVAMGEKLDIADAGIHEGTCIRIALEALEAAGAGKAEQKGERTGNGEPETPADVRLAPDALLFEQDRYLRFICESVGDKILRTIRNDRKHPMSEADIRENLITGFAGGFYLYFRDVFNRIAAGTLEATPAQRCANFFFVREYCYGSMFRYNAKGEFNIPYGGKSYNRKDFRSKVERIFAPETAALLSGVQLTCMDFEEMMEAAELTGKDFVFLDPPYDTEFSDYEGKDFTREDHRRLAQALERTKAKFLLVIKNTEFIYSLYEGKFPMYAFENRYVYNVRSRNERRAEHLIITNCEMTADCQAIADGDIAAGCRNADSE